MKSLIDQIHPSTLSFGSSISVTKLWASPLTLQCAKDDLLPLLTHHNLYRSFALSILTQDHDSSYSKSMVFTDSDYLSQTSRPLIREPVRPDEEMIYSTTRIRCPQWFNASHCDLFYSCLLPFGLIIHPRLAIIITIILCSRWGRSSFHPRNSLNYLSIIIGCSYLSFILPWVDSTLLKHSHPSLFNKSSWIPEGASVEVGTTCCWGQAP